MTGVGEVVSHMTGVAGGIPEGTEEWVLTLAEEWCWGIGQRVGPWRLLGDLLLLGGLRKGPGARRPDPQTQLQRAPEAEEWVAEWTGVLVEERGEVAGTTEEELAEVFRTGMPGLVAGVGEAGVSLHRGRVLGPLLVVHLQSPREQAP